jgi:hypothetical protein
MGPSDKSIFEFRPTSRWLPSRAETATLSDNVAQELARIFEGSKALRKARQRASIGRRWRSGSNCGL